jgi:hypothetical protein
MARNYYYLVAGLPDLIFDGDKKVAGFAEFLNNTADLVHATDARLMNEFRWKYDNSNLLSLLHITSDNAFDARGSKDLPALEEEIKNTEDAPAYRATFIEAFKQDKPLFPGLSWENQLAALFFNTMLAHKNLFVRQWFEFELNLRNILAAANCQSSSADAGFSLALASEVLPLNDIAEQLLKSQAPDFGLSSQFPWMDKLVTAKGESPVEHQKTIDLIRWDYLADLTTFSYFTIEMILAFALRLAIVERWLALDVESGRQAVARLVAELAATAGIDGAN